MPPMLAATAAVAAAAPLAHRRATKSASVPRRAEHNMLFKGSTPFQSALSEKSDSDKPGRKDRSLATKANSCAPLAALCAPCRCAPLLLFVGGKGDELNSVHRVRRAFVRGGERHAVQKRRGTSPSVFFHEASAHLNEIIISFLDIRQGP